MSVTRRLAAVLCRRALLAREENLFVASLQRNNYLQNRDQSINSRLCGRGGTEMPTAVNLVQKRFSQCSCPGMDKLPSNKLLMEYNPEDVDRFIEVADAVEDAFPGLVVEGIEAVEGAHVFAVKMEDGTLIFSHGDRSSLPGNEEIIGVIRAAGAGEQTI